MKILQDYIVPVVRTDTDDRGIAVKGLFGTAFFINSRGVFVTARHVIENCEADVVANGGRIGLVMRKPGDNKYRYHTDIVHFTCHDPPYDVAVGVADKPSTAAFLFGEGCKVLVWDDVYTAGYPETAMHQLADQFRIDARGHKGQVLRKLPPGHFLVHPHPDVIELSFPITKGLSGAPLVLRDQHDADGNPLPYFVLIGVCVGNQPSEIVDFSHTEVTEEGNEFKETKSRIEEYGIAHDIRPLADWRPACLGDMTLRDAIQPNN